MATLNIRRDVKDSFYRYKMPRLQSKIEGKGNGIKTVIPNMAEVAKSLARPPTYTTKFFGCELGAQVKCEEKNDRYIVNGAHDAEKLQTLLDGFINKFVLCPDCKNPETDLKILKNETIIRDCKACGQKNDVDMRHKLCTFILKNPPEGTTNKASKKAAKLAAKKGSTDDATNKSPVGAGLPSPPDTASNDSNDEVARPKAVAKSPVSAGGPDAEEEDEDWAEDTSPAAIQARMKELSVNGAVAKMTEADDDDDEDGDDPLELFAKFITETPAASNEDIVDHALSLGVKDHKACVVLAQVLFTADMLKEVKSRAALLKLFVKNEKCQKGLLGGIERLVGMEHKELMTKIPLVLKAFYDLDLLEEEVILSWGEKASKKYVDRKLSKEIRDKAEPFLKWLREAEEDDDDDDDEEEESDEE